MNDLTLWKCDDGTYDLCENGEVIRQNIPRAALLQLQSIEPPSGPAVEAAQVSDERAS